MKITEGIGPLRRFVLASLLSLLLGATASARDILTGPVPARVLGVIDGDTLVVRAHIWLDQDVETHVRLTGIDAPELKGRCAAERERALAAKDFLARSAGSDVLLDNVSWEKYGGRVRANVRTADGADLARLLVDAGHARPYDGGKRGPWCEEAAAPRAD